jgi:hypothetical protein
MEKHQKIMNLNTIIKSAKVGDTKCAVLLLKEAAIQLCDNTLNGKQLRAYIQECLKKIECDENLELFSNKKINEKKTVFFNAFNLGKPNHRPQDERVEQRF